MAFTFHHHIWWVFSRYDYRQTPNYIDEQACDNYPTQSRVAMFWGWRSGRNYTGLLPDDADYVLGFNEPNHSGQANLTPEEAVEGWKEIERVAGDRLLVTPAAAPCGSGLPKCLNNTMDWFDEFFRLCDDCRFDYMATHHYSKYPSSTMSYLESLYERYGLQIWLTEFARPQTSNETEILSYMSGVLPLLEEADYVFRYSWYVNRKFANGWTHSEISLQEADNSNFTLVGKYYNAYQPDE